MASIIHDEQLVALLQAESNLTVRFAELSDCGVIIEDFCPDILDIVLSILGCPQDMGDAGCGNPECENCSGHAPTSGRLPFRRKFGELMQNEMSDESAREYLAWVRAEVLRRNALN